MVFLLIFILGIVLHELIHAATWILVGRRPASSMSFGMKWKTLTPYVHLREPVEVNAYRTGTLMPGILLGILPSLAAILTGSAWLLAFGLTFTLAAGSDLLILWLLRRVPAGKLVEDHPTRAGTYMLD